MKAKCTHDVATYSARLVVKTVDGCKLLRQVEVDDRGIIFDGEVFATRAHLFDALVERVDAAGRCQVVVVVRPTEGYVVSVVVRTPTHAGALELVRALELGPSHHLLEVELGGSFTAVEWLLALVLTFLFAGSFAVAFMMESAFTIPLFVAMTLPWLTLYVASHTCVAVGHDGVRRSSMLGERFLRYEDLRSVDRDVLHGAVLTTKSGETIRLFRAENIIYATTLGELFYRRIWQAFLACSLGYAKSREVGLAEPRIDRLRALKSGGGSRGYRVAPSVPAALEDAVVDSTESLDTRVAAAIALRAKGGENAAKRIREVANASASPKVRVLFERIADDAAAEEIARHMDAANVK